MTIRRFVGRVTLLALTAASLSGCTVDQIMMGQWYYINTPPQGACPLLEWDFVVDPARTITGSLLLPGQRTIATLSGTLAKDESFHITAKAVAGPQTADVTGRFTSGVSVISIRGDAAGSGCDGQTFALRLSGYFALQGLGDLDN